VADEQELQSDIIRAKKFPDGGRHPLKKIPGFPKKAEWNPYLGRWVIYRKVVG
jgi:hypothetical protein